MGRPARTAIRENHGDGSVVPLSPCLALCICNARFARGYILMEKSNIAGRWTPHGPRLVQVLVCLAMRSDQNNEYSPVARQFAALLPLCQTRIRIGNHKRRTTEPVQRMISIQ